MLFVGDNDMMMLFVVYYGFRREPLETKAWGGHCCIWTSAYRLISRVFAHLEMTLQKWTESNEMLLGPMLN